MVHRPICHLYPGVKSKALSRHASPPLGRAAELLTLLDVNLIRYRNCDEADHCGVLCYRESGNEPVRDWLLELAREDRKIIGEDIATVEFGWPIGMPTCKDLREGVREVRSTIKRGKVEARTYFSIEGGTMLLSSRP